MPAHPPEPQVRLWGFLAEAEEQFVLTETCEGSREPQNVQDVPLTRLFPKGAVLGADVQAGIGCFSLMQGENA